LIKLCPTCGHEVPFENRFCGNCGNKFEPAGAAAAPAKTMFFGATQTPGRAKLTVIKGEGLDGVTYLLNATERPPRRVASLLRRSALLRDGTGLHFEMHPHLVRHILLEGDFGELSTALSGVHRFPIARSRYIVASRDFLSSSIQLRLHRHLTSLKDPIERRDWLVKEKRIKGLGYKEASHYLRNIGLSGYGILDKHILNCLRELELIDDPKPPSTRAKYLATEEKLRELASVTKIHFDELDLVLWSMKTGEILK